MRKRFQFGLILTTGVFLFATFVNTASAITITPPRLELAGDPGSTISGEVKVTNESTTDTTYYTQVENFEAGDETGNPQFVPTKEGLATWVNVADNIRVKANEQKVVPFTIQIPDNTEPGGYFASIFVRTTPPPANTAGEVSIGARLGSLILLHVNGDIREGVSILEFSTKDKKRFYTTLPVETYYRFQNTGADRVKPEGDIVVKNIFGLTAKVLNANRSEGSVLPRSIRRFESAWINDGGGVEDPELLPPAKTNDGFFGEAKKQAKNFAFGYYTAHLDIHYGENNQSANQKFRFFVIPWQLLIIVIVGLFILLVVAKFILRRYTNYIIRSHQKRQ